MNWQTIIYFSSVLVTFLLTGFLAWYAWRQGSLPVARPYAWLVLAECLMALTEILSMLSPGEALARIWFNTRFLFAASMPVFFFIFALEYNARRRWHTKRLLAGLFVLPFFTQIILWTNNLHSLWVTQDVGFHQSGPFWLVETGLRVPGLWFLVHNFYGELLLLAGIVILLLAAWGKRKTYLGPSLLLSAGALVGLLAAIIPAFNLLPQLKFNPFIPGIGLSALLYGLAILRFDFLKRFPGMEAAAPSTALDSQEKRSLALFLVVFLLLVSGIASAGYLSYGKFQHDFRTQAEAQLSAIANLKVNEMANWHRDRLADGDVFLHNPAFSVLVTRILDDPADEQAQGELQAWLDATRTAFQYGQIYLLDPNGGKLLGSPAGSAEIPGHVIGDVPPVLQSGQVTFLDFHRHTDGSIHLGLLVPILADGDVNLPLAVLFMEIDPNVYLYPFLDNWPAPSETAETLLVRRDGEDVLFLNPLRFQPDAALNLRFPLTDTTLPAAKAVLGEAGIVEGVDYRGVDVLGAVEPVPDTPWFIVARMDAAEVYAPLRARLWQTLVFFGALILATGLGLGLAWRGQRLRYYSERSKVAEALRESEEKFKYVFEYSNVGKSITLPSGEIQVNTAFCELLGFSREELQSKKWQEITHPDDMESTQKIVTALLSGETESARFSKRYVHKNGSSVWTDVSTSLRRDKAGKPLYFMTSIVDITDRKQAEDKLVASEVRYRRLFEAAKDGILILDAETGVVVDVNPFLVELLGLPQKKLLGKKIWDLGFFNDVAANQANFLELQQEEYIRYENLPLETANGQRLNVEFVSNVYQVDHHKVIQCNIRDITERKKAERALQESEVRLLAILDSTPFPIALVDEQDNIISFWSQSATALFGHTAPTAKEWYQIAYPDPEYRREVITRWKPMVEKARSSSKPVNAGEYRVTCKDGSERICELYAAFIQDKLVVTFNDITKRKEAEEAIKTYADKLEAMVEERTRKLEQAQEKMVRQERLATLGQIAGSIGHELRNPLGVISNAVYYLKMSQPEANESMQEYLGIIETETRNSEKIITDLLDFTRGKVSQSEPVVVDRLVERVLERYPAPASVTVTHKLPARLPKILADPGQVEQVLGNLVVNAFQAMPQGGRLTISAQAEDKMVGIVIRDTGVGIPAEIMDRLFEPLFTTKARGIGLGLAVCRKLVEVNNGWIEVASKPGKGSLFTIHLPIYKEQV
jgi:PAS domain S-box-containing protein